jgi:hypothetical protein
MLYDLDLESIGNKPKREYLYYYVEILSLITITILLRSGTKENEELMESFLDEIKDNKPNVYDWIMQKPFYRHPIRPIRILPRFISYPTYRISYRIARRHFVFN